VSSLLAVFGVITKHFCCKPASPSKKGVHSKKIDAIAKKSNTLVVPFVLSWCTLCLLEYVHEI
jgi:hypothetical protein